MKKYFVTYRPFLKFLFLFFVTYGVFSFLYHLYLSQYKDLEYPIDPFTESVSYQVKYISNLFGSAVEIHKLPNEQWTRVFYIDRYVARVVEGCNAVSVMILFTSFVIAFAGKFKRTLVFILIGIFLIHILNLFRIALLVALLYHYPQHSHLTHGVLFPLIIYGFVFLLWIIWVRKYSGFISDKKDESN